jgi:hypothetical protein
MTPAPGTLVGPPEWGFDDSVLEEGIPAEAAKPAKTKKGAKKKGDRKAESKAGPAGDGKVVSKKRGTKRARSAAPGTTRGSRP